MQTNLQFKNSMALPSTTATALEVPRIFVASTLVLQLCDLEISEI